MARRRPAAARFRPSRSRRLRRWFFGLNLGVALILGGWFVAQPPTRRHEVQRLVTAAWARDKHVSAVDIAWDIWQLYYANPAQGRIAAGDKTHIYGGVPRRLSAIPSAPLRVLVNRGYVVGYDDARGNPAWVAYRVRDLPAIPPAPPRPEQFAVDRRTAARVSPDDYTGSGYDRGHLAPNFAIATRHGAAGQAETFLMSNITPQRHAMNAGLWRALEHKIATSYPARYEDVWVLTGPIFGPRPDRLRGGVEVPEAFWMIVVDEHEGKLRTLSFIVPQDAPSTTSPRRCLASIDEIERRTHLDLLPELDDDAEVPLEHATPARVW